ncbi:MAG: hypothetical protein ABEJ04_02505 [Halobacteriaceae archaeon]
MVGRQRGRDERGQLFLVTALVIAVTFVALALFLNTAIYTENLAMRESAADDQALTHLDALESSYGGVLFYTNYRDHHDYATLNRSLHDNVANLSDYVGFHAATDGSVVASSLVDVTNGTYVVQDVNRTLESAGGARNWTLAEADAVRRFELTLRRSSLYNVSALDALFGGDAFRVRADNGSAERTVFVYGEVGSPDVVNVTVKDGTGDLLGSCTASASAVTVDLTEGTVGGEPCPGLEFPVDGTSRLTFNDSDQANGTYHLLVAGTDVRDGNFHPDASPYTAPALYSATLNVTYRSPSVSYRGNVTAAPEDPPCRSSGTCDTVADLPDGAGPLTFVDGGRLYTLRPDGTRTAYQATGVVAVGPKRVDFDGDGLEEIPYVTAGDEVKLVDSKNRTQTLVSGDVRTAHTRLAVDATGVPTVLYSNGTDHLYEVGLGGSPSAVGVEGTGASGVADFDGDGDRDVVYAGGSDSLQFYDGTVQSTAWTVGTADGLGTGEPAFVPSRSANMTPVVNDTNELWLVDDDGDATDDVDLATAGHAPAQTAVATVDWNGDGTAEVVWADASGDLWYTTLDGTVRPVRDDGGTQVAVDVSAGVA